jgi:hypothetical protein
MLRVFVKETVYFVNVLNPSNLKHKRCIMTEKTLPIFQLFLAIFAVYAILDHTGNYHLLVPFFCLTGMFFVGREEVDFKKISGEVRYKSQEGAFA